MPTQNLPSFWQIARQPKWIAALLGVAAVAAVFAGLAQWQLERTFVTVGTLNPNQPAVPIDVLMTPGEPILSANLDREVSAAAKLDYGRSWLIENRQQLVGESSLQAGYWLVTLAQVEHPELGPTDLAVAVGFTADRQTAEAALRDVRAKAQEPEEVNLRGYLEPNEAPITATNYERVNPDVLQSLSVGQLVNMTNSDIRPVYPGFVIAIDGPVAPAGFEPIRIAIQSATIEINWLTAFYALEWGIFIAFAFYVWWRLVQDARLRSVIKS